MTDTVPLFTAGPSLVNLTMILTVFPYSLSTVSIVISTLYFTFPFPAMSFPSSARLSAKVLPLMLIVPLLNIAPPEVAVLFVKVEYVIIPLASLKYIAPPSCALLMSNWLWWIYPFLVLFQHIAPPN